MAHDLVQVLRDLEQELEEAERELAALQLRVEGLRETTDGLKKLMRAEREATPQPSAEVSPAMPAPRATPATPTMRAAAPASTMPTLWASSVTSPPKPTTSAGALAIIQSNVNRRWPVREIWQNMVERGWVANTGDSRSAVRIALKRLAEKYPDQLERVPDGPTFAYRWTGDVNTNGHSPSS
jgi:hypothetical protein